MKCKKGTRFRQESTGWVFLMGAAISGRSYGLKVQNPMCLARFLAAHYTLSSGIAIYKWDRW